MPTIPVFFIGITSGNYSLLDTPGWRGRAASARTGSGCLPLSSNVSWDGEIVPGVSPYDRDISEITFSPDEPLVLHGAGGLHDSLTTGTITYPDEWGAIITDAEHWIESLTPGTFYPSHQVIPAASTVFMVAAFVVTPHDDDTVTFATSFQDYQVYWDGASYYTGTNRAQLKINETVYDIPLTGTSVRTDTQARYDQSSNPHTLKLITIDYAGEITFPRTADAVYFRTGDDYGVWNEWHLMKLVPFGFFTSSVDDDGLLTVDMTGIKALGTTITNYRVLLLDGRLKEPPYIDSASPIVTYDISNSTLPPGTEFYLQVQATTAYGCQTMFTGPTMVMPEPAIFGSFVDPGHVLFSAVNEDTGVRVSRFPAGADSRELLALVEDAKGPSLYRRGGRTITCGYTQRSTGDYVEVDSSDDGRSFG